MEKGGVEENKVGEIEWVGVEESKGGEELEESAVHAWGVHVPSTPPPVCVPNDIWRACMRKRRLEAEQDQEQNLPSCCPICGDASDDTTMVTFPRSW